MKPITSREWWRTDKSTIITYTNGVGLTIPICRIGIIVSLMVFGSNPPMIVAVPNVAADGTLSWTLLGNESLSTPSNATYDRDIDALTVALLGV